LKITIRNLQKKLPIYPKRIKKPILKALKDARKTKGEITVSFVDDKLIKKLNSKYLKTRKATDVLAFDLADKTKSEEISGDIIVSADTAVRNAMLYKTTPSFELSLYSLHGLLHLLGYKDKSLKQIKLMRKKESEYVNP